MLNSNEKQEVSRYDLKKQIEAIQSFDLSSFQQSKNKSTNHVRGLIHPTGNQSLFPKVDAPTLQLLEDSEYNIRYLDHLETKPKQKPKKKQEKTNHQYYEDLTARNSQTSNIYQYQQKIDEMKIELQKLQIELDSQKRQKKLLHERINIVETHHKKVNQQLKEKIKEQKEQIMLLKEREIKAVREKELLQKQLSKYLDKPYISRQSRAGSVSSGNSIHSNTVLMTSYMQEPSLFCPQLLSPQQTVALLSKLLKKVSKSSKMIKQLTDDQSVKTILSKIQKK